MRRLTLGLACVPMASACATPTSPPQSTTQPDGSDSPVFGSALSLRSYEGSDIPDFLDEVEGNAGEIVRGRSPDTKLFATFQYQWMLGHRGGWCGGTQVAPDWTPIDEFAKADTVGFPSRVE